MSWPPPAHSLLDLGGLGVVRDSARISGVQVGAGQVFVIGCTPLVGMWGCCWLGICSSVRKPQVAARAQLTSQHLALMGCLAVVEMLQSVPSGSWEAGDRVTGWHSCGLEHRCACLCYLCSCQSTGQARCSNPVSTWPDQYKGLSPGIPIELQLPL